MTRSDRYGSTAEAPPLEGLRVSDLSRLTAGNIETHVLASSERLVIPGHDPEVMRDYPVAEPGLEGIAVRLD